MPSPKDYIAREREADLAERVWQLTVTLPKTGWSQVTIHDAFAKLPGSTVGSYWPGTGSPVTGRVMKGGVVAVNSKFGGTDFTAKEIGYVEHFYVSAMIGTIGGPGAGPVLNSIACGLWEFVIGPGRTVWDKRDLPSEQILEYVWRNVKHNFGQYVGPDFEGMRFGAMFPIAQLAELWPKEPAPPSQRTGNRSRLNRDSISA